MNKGYFAAPVKTSAGLWGGFGRDVGLLLGTSLIMGFTIFGGIYTVLLNLYLLRLGYGPEFVGAVNAAGSLAFVVCSVPAGIMGNRWGNRRMLIGGLFLSMAGHGLLPLAEQFAGAWQRGWLMGAFGLGAVGTNLFFVNVFPFMMRKTAATERHRVFATQVAIWPLAAFAGSLIGGFLPGLCAAALGLGDEAPAAYRYPLFAAAALLALGVAAMCKTGESPTAQAEDKAARTGRPPYVLIAFMMTVTLFQTVGEGAARTFFNVYLDDGLGLSTEAIGGLTAVGQLLAVGGALAAPLLARRWRRESMIIGGSLGMACCLLPLALVPHWLAAGLGFMGLIAMGALRRPLYIVFQQESVPQHWRVAMSSAVSMAYGISSAGIALGGGYVVVSWGYETLFLLGAGLTAVGGLVFWGYFRVPRGEYVGRG